MPSPEEHAGPNSAEDVGGDGPLGHAEPVVERICTPAITTASTNRRWISWISNASVERTAVAIILAITIWLAHFSHSPHFGLYEDDWAFIGQPSVWQWANLQDWLKMCYHAWPQGRPIGFAAVGTISYLGSRIGGLEFLYCLAWAMHVGNALLVYAIVRKKLSAAPSLCAALTFALFPSNTSLPLLTNSFFGSITIFFLLLATWLYLRGWRAAAYVISIGSLLTYESAFLPFFAAPLLDARPLRQMRRELARHWAILLAIGGFLFWFRLRIGENKTAAVIKDGPLGTLERILTAMYVGVFTTFRLFFSRIATLLREGDREIWQTVFVVAIGLAIALYLLVFRSSNALEVWPFSLTMRDLRFRAILTVDENSARAIQVGACGFVMLVLAYGLAISAYYYPPNIEAGRLTFTHLSASVGSALLFGGLASLLIDLGQSHHKKILVTSVLGVYFAGLVGFHGCVQRDFVRSWRIQQTFWRSVLRLCPDLKEGTVIIYEAAYAQPLYVLANSWADPLVLGEMYRFPSNWKTLPQLFSASPVWPADVVTVGNVRFWRPPVPFPSEILPEGNVILLRGSPEGDLKRVTGTVMIKGSAFPLKPLEAPRLPPYEHSLAIYNAINP